MGLSITKQLLDAHLGAIAVISEENKGSDFSFYIPLADEKKMFIMDTNQTFGTGDDSGILHIKEKTNCGFIDEVLKENLIKLSKKSKEFKKDGDYFVLLPDTSISALDFMEKTILDEFKKPVWQNCDIVLKKAHSKKDGKELKKILEKINI